MGSNGVIVEGFGRNSGDDDCMLNCLPEMKNVCFEHFKPFQDKMSLVLQHSRSHFSALAGRESFAGFLNVPLISDVLVKTIEVMFGAPKPCVVQPQNDEASANISWLDVVKERNYQAEYKGNGIYHFHMQDSGVIVHLSAFQHNMILSGLPRKLVQPWSYEKDVQTELNTLALAAEMTTLLNELASEVIKVNNTVLGEIVRRDQILRRNLQSSQRSADSPFPPESAESPASSMPAQGDTASLNGNAIETQNTDTEASASTRGARATKNFPKNRLWPSEVLEELPEWFEDQVRKDLSQEEIARNFQRKYKQKRTFHAIEAKVYYLTGKSPFRKRGKKTSRKIPVSLAPRSSPPLSQPSESVGQQLITRSNIEVQALHLAPNLLPYLISEGREDGNLHTLHGVQPVDPESGYSDSHAVHEQETPYQGSSCLRDSQEHVLESDQRQNECPVRGSPQAGESPKAHAAFSDLVSEIQPRNENLINVLDATSAKPGTVDPYLPRSSPLGSPWISEPIQPPIRHHPEDGTTLEEPGQTLIHRTGTIAMHVNQTDTGHDKPSERLSHRSSPRESHTESGPGVLTVPRASTPFRVPEPSSTGNSTGHHSGNCGMDGPTTNTPERAFIDEELVIRCLQEKSQAQAARSRRPWSKEHLNPPAVPAVLDIPQISRSPNTIIGCDNSRLDFPRNSTPPFHVSEEAVDHNLPAAAASDYASEQTVFVTPSENVEDTPTLGNRRHRVGITPKPPARFTAINGGIVHRTGSNISEMAPLVQIERDALPSGQGIQQTSTEMVVEQRRDDQNVSQQEGTLTGGRGHLNKLVSEHELAGSNHSELSTGTPEGAGNQGSLSIDISDTEISQLGTNLQNTSQSQERDVDISTPHNPQATYIQPPIRNCPYNAQVANSRPSHFCEPNPRSEISQTSGVPGSAHTGGSFTPNTSGPTYSDMRSEAVVPISVSASFLSSPTGIPHYPLHELQGGGAKRYQGPPLPSLAQQVYYHRAGEPLHR
ncbi:hypothetical protein PENNAL_c0069G02399 [Penicillium nalgiovense]|uniref:Uncharacterized protein n=1 Tax=Penicillium nalgiovense TaxID=60175 RepID=A0A1V6XM31_PENNA|nr:hypothetical protein PENNAL_c0069G02399 [Penicillium nalgiovense]